MRVVATAALAAALAGCGAMAGDGPGRSASGDMPAMRSGMPAGMQGGMPGRMQGGMPGGMQGGMPGGMQGRPGAAMGMANHMRAMDANGDGMLSKQEFLKAHEAMFDKMKKNEQGQVDIASMGSMGAMEMCPMMK